MASSAEELQGMINELSAEFDNLVLDRHIVGQSKYGPLTFLEKDIFEETYMELADTANYVRYQYIKLRMLQLAIAKDPSVEQFTDGGGGISIGLESFTPTAKD
jgi:hypothetical protein